MTYYGPWVQAPDFEKFQGVAGADPAVVGTGYLEDFINQPAAMGFYVPGAAEAMAQQQNANATLTEPNPLADIPTGGGPMGFAIGYGGVLMPGDVVPSISQTWMRSVMHFHPMSVSPFNAGAHNWAPFLAPGGVPAGAIGWQWQSDLSEGAAKPGSVVTAELEITYTPTEANYSENGVDGTLAGDIVTELKALGGDFASDDLVGLAGAFYGDTLMNWGTGPPNNGVVVATMVGTGGDDPDPITLDPVDITEHLDTLGRTALGIHMQFPPAPMLPPDLSESSDISYGYDVVPTVHWTFRPPIFRWIYDGATVAPPLRLYPRHDNLGNSPRIHPHPPTRQRSNRISGYL